MMMFLDKYFSIFLVCFLASSPFLNCVPVGSDNELKEHEHEYKGLLTQAIPTSVTRFSITLSQKLSEETTTGSNILTSPVNAYAALYLLHLAAGDETRNKINEVLKLRESNVDVSKMHETFSELYKKMEHTSPHPEFAETETIFANGLFVHKDYPILDSFIQELRKYYHANVTNVDFAAHADEATDSINSFISENTRKRIDKFYKESLPSNTNAVIASALYFKGQWEHAFDPEETLLEKFNTGSEEMEVSMMHSRNKIQYSYSDLLQADSIELRYKGREYATIIILPRPGQTLKNLTNHLHSNGVHQELDRNSKSVRVDYKIPKMKFTWEGSLIQPLQLEDTFRTADLSRMTTQKVTVSDMKQVTEMEVDEYGTVATAATTIGLSRSFHPVLPEDGLVNFHVDRPFLMVIIHVPTQFILFEGLIYKPIVSSH